MFGAMPRLLHHPKFSSRPFRLHVRALDVSLVHVARWRIFLTRNPTCSGERSSSPRRAEARFRCRGGYIGLQPSQLVKVLPMSPTYQSSPRAGFNRNFLITSHDDLQMVTRIPYPATVPKYCAVASEVATMEFLRSSGCLFPRCPDTHLRRTTRWRPSTSL